MAGSTWNQMKVNYLSGLNLKWTHIIDDIAPYNCLTHQVKWHLNRIINHISVNLFKSSENFTITKSRALSKLHRSHSSHLSRLSFCDIRKLFIAYTFIWNTCSESRYLSHAPNPCYFTACSSFLYINYIELRIRGKR